MSRFAPSLTRAALASFLYLAASASAQAIDRVQAQAAFTEARDISARDAGHLWGRLIYGPMLFVLPADHTVVANEPAAGNQLHQEGSVWVGTLPPEIMLANTAFNWGGKRWTMVMWPLPGNSQPRRRLLAHELFHRIQDDLHLPLSNPDNAHLDTMEGRLWLQLEWRALAVALTSTGVQRLQAAQDAVVFAQHRHQLFPGSAVAENQLLLNEGLAEYTGLALATPDAASARWRTAQRLVSPESNTFVRSFAYASGPAYALLLDELKPGWRNGMNETSSLETLLASALPRKAPAAADTRAAIYGGVALRIVESERETVQTAARDRYRKLLVDGPTLRLPGSGSISVSFDPNDVLPLAKFGNINPTMHASDAWGVLDAQKGALVAPDFSSVVVSAPTSLTPPHIAGDGWTLELAPGWRLASSGTAGSFVLQKE